MIEKGYIFMSHVFRFTFFRFIFCWLILIAAFSISAQAQSNRIDIIRHDAPELASYGDLNIGVRTVIVTDNNRPDILMTKQGEATVYYNRDLTLEIWYPAQLKTGQQTGGQYISTTPNTAINATLTGKAVRNANPLQTNIPYPLVIISHGYPGNRYLMSHLGENLASKGYIVASIDHSDSTYEDRQGFASTLYNRPLDQRFVISEMAAMNNNAGSFLAGILNADLTALIGYSMGGYGAINNLGGGYNPNRARIPVAPPNDMLLHHSSSNPDFRNSLDTRIKAGVAIAPWGMATGMWRAEDLHNISVPTLFVAGSLDKVAGYEKGIRSLYKNAINSDRYLLTYINAGHSAGAPIPTPVEIVNSESNTGADHYTDRVWDNVRMNNIMDHFITAFLDLKLKDKTRNQAWLDLVPDSSESVYSMKAGKPTKTHTYWKGFPQGTAIGLKLEHLAAEQ
ncbi:MAG: putative dienelactone hydrolase [Oceanicoccus sp.]